MTGFIVNKYITIGYIYCWIHCQQEHYYWIYLSLDIFSTTTLLLNIFRYIVNEYISIGYIYHWIYSQRVHYYWIYLSPNIFSMSILLLIIFITEFILNDNIKS